MAASSSGPAAREQFKTLHRPTEPRSIIITIPGARCDLPGDWSHPEYSDHWLKKLASEADLEPAIYSFHCGCLEERNGSWRELLDHGPQFVHHLATLHREHEAKPLPIVIVSHCLGGLVAKKAICSIVQQGLQPLRDAVAAVVFLGTPHSRLSTARVWTSVNTLLRRRSRRYGRSQSIDDQDAENLATLCREFEDVSADLPILSILETLDSSTGSSLLRTRTRKIVEEQCGTTKCLKEEILHANVDHFGLCTMKTKSTTFERLTQFLVRSVVDSSERIIQCLQRSAPAAYLADSTIDGTHTPFSTPDEEHTRHLVNPLDKSRVPVLPHRSGSSEDMTDLTKMVEVWRHSEDMKFNLPYYETPYERNQDFFGRTDVLRNIHDHLCPTTSAEVRELKTFAICGLGGIGKTQTAAQYAYLHYIENGGVFDAVLWMRADTRAKLAADFSSRAVQLGLVLEESLAARDLNAHQKLVKDWLKNPVRVRGQSVGEIAKWLLVFDNADNPELLKDFWPAEGSFGSVLITSRDPITQTRLHNVDHGVRLQPFSTNDGADLLLTLTERTDDQEDRVIAPLVADKLAGYPLALTQMAGYIVRNEITFAEFLARYNEEHDQSILFGFRCGSDPYEHTLATVFSLDKLETESLALLEVLSLMDSDLSEEILEENIGRIRLKGFPATSAQYQDARTVLMRSSLVSRNRPAKTLSVNIMVQDVVRTHMSALRFRQVFLFVLQLLSRLWPGRGLNAVRQDNRRFRPHQEMMPFWKRYEILSPHALRLKDKLSKQSRDDQDTLALSVMFAHLLGEVGWYLDERSQAKMAIDCLTVARDNLIKIVAEDARNPGATPYLREAPSFENTGQARTVGQLDEGNVPPSVLLAETYRNLAFTAAGMSDVETCFNNYLQYNNMMVQELGAQAQPKDQRLAISYLELGVARGFRMEYAESRRCSEKTLELVQWLDEPEVAVNLRTLAVANLSLALLELGQPEAALEIAVEQRDRRQDESVGRDLFVKGRLWHALGNIYAALRHHDQSFIYHQRAMFHYENTVGHDYHRAGDMYFKVGQHHVRMNQFAQADELFERALAVYNLAYHKAERARVLHWQAKIAPADKAATLEGEAARLLQETRLERGIEGSSVEDREYDRLVVFWSR